MEKENSYNYVFWETIKYIDKVEVVYRHEALLTVEDENAPFPMPTGSQWCLNLVSICETKEKTKFNNIIAENIDSRIDYIKENRLDLFGFYKYFIVRIQRAIDNFSNLRNGNIKFEDLINQKIITLKYLGYLPFHEHFHLHQLGINGKPLEAEFDEKAFDEIYKLTKSYFDVIIKELTRLILFIKHELNLSIINRQQLESHKGKEVFINLIKKGEIEKLFTEFGTIEEYKYDEDVIQLSARYFKLENDKNKDIISRDEYNIQSSKLISSLIKVISKN